MKIIDEKQRHYSDIITSFLSSHPLISVNALEKTCSIPQATLAKAISKDRIIPDKHIYPLICTLSEYGLNIDGYSLTFEKEAQTIFASMDVELVETVELENSFDYIVKQYRWMASDYFDLP